MADHQTVLANLLDLATQFSGRDVLPTSLIYQDLDINGSDFIEFVEEIERTYDLDLSWISPCDPRASAQDVTVEAIAFYVVKQRSGAD